MRANASVSPGDRGKGSGLKKDVFVLVFSLGCFDFFLYFLSQGHSYVTCQIPWVRSLSPVCMFGK